MTQTTKESTKEPVKPRYRRIFWLDDDPYYTLASIYIANKFMKKDTLIEPSLLKRIEFAHDAAEGAAKVRAQAYDLIILDGDFPQSMTPEHRVKVEQFVNRYRAGEDFETLASQFKELDMDPSYGEHDGGRFEAFYQNYVATLEPRCTKVVVHSQSGLNLIPALVLGLPFYSKDPRTDLEDVLAMGLHSKHAGRRELTTDEIAFLEGQKERKQLEFGKMFEFIQKYLVLEGK